MKNRPCRSAACLRPLELIVRNSKLSFFARERLLFYFSLLNFQTIQLHEQVLDTNSVAVKFCDLG